MIPRIDLAELGRRLDLSKRPRSWGGACPACDYRGAFSMKAGKRGGVLAYCANGCPPDALDAALTRALGAEWTPREPAPDGNVAAARAGKQATALRMWSRSTPAPGTLADRYLTGRALPGLAASAALRFLGDCWHPEGGKLPALVALVALVLDAAGQPLAVHRTYLAHDGAKAALDPAKMSLGPVWGGAIRLTPDPAPSAELVVGEGIESSASAGLLLGLPAWAALSAGNLARGLVLPPEVRAVTIAADADAVGLREAHHAARRWRAEGRTVRVVAPDVAGWDFNDALRSDGGDHAGNR